MIYRCGTCEAELKTMGDACGHSEHMGHVVSYTGSHPIIVDDTVNSPGHYTRLEPQPIEVIEKWRLPFHEAQVIKYISRAGHKDPSKHLEDLKKAEFYLSRRIAQLEKGAGNK